MSIRIEILDYVNDATAAANIIDDPSFTNAANWTTGSNWNVSGGSATHSANGGGVANNLLTTTNFSGGNLQVNKRYRLTYTISNSNNTGALYLYLHQGVTSLSLGIINGTHTIEWQQGPSFIDNIQIYATGNFAGDIDSLYVYPLSGIDWDKSIVGELDVASHAEFPLSLTFQISDVQKLTSTSGTYSKTFKVPATKNNNKLLKNLYIPSTSPDNEVTTMKSCRIIVDNLFSITGNIQVTGVSGYKENASYYDCVFYGNNLTWATLIADKKLSELDWQRVLPTSGLTTHDYNLEGVINTWAYEDCDDAENDSSFFVYPVVSYGEFNPTGIGDTIQLLKTRGQTLNPQVSAKKGYVGFSEPAGVPYGTPMPSPDWRPCIFVKSTLKKIFNTAGYTIKSNFMDTQMFKQLVWSLPNFKWYNKRERYENFSLVSQTGGDILHNETINQTVSQNYSSGQFTFKYWRNIDFTTASSFSATYKGCGSTDCSSSIYGLQSDGTFVVSEYGLYDLHMDKSISVNLSNLTGPAPVGAGSFRMQDVKVQIGFRFYTVGEGTASGFYYSQIMNSSKPLWGDSQYHAVDANHFHEDDFEPTDDIEITRWLNKGDVVVPTVKVTFKPNFNMVSGDDFSFVLKVGTQFATSVTAGNYNIEMDAERVEWGQNLNFQQIINPALKQIDFIKGVSHAFNLQFSTDDIKKEVTIEPFDDFYKTPSSAYDWNHKLDLSQETHDRWLKTDLKRTFIFKYKTDDADKNALALAEPHFDGIRDVFPYKDTLSTNFDIGESVFENPFFAGTLNAPYNYQGTISFPHAYLATEQSSYAQSARPPKGFDFLPRLLYYQKYSPTTNESFLGPNYIVVQEWNAMINLIQANASASSNNSLTGGKFLPQAVSYNYRKDAYPNLAYGNIWLKEYDEANQTYANPVGKKGLYQTYYEQMFLRIIQNPRVRTVHLDLKISDMIQLDLRELIYLDGVYWRINRVIDYQPHKNTPTKVELIEHKEVGVRPVDMIVFNQTPKQI